MSSVLRALKKLEQESNAASGMPGGIGARSGRGVSPALPLQRRLLPVLLILLMISGGIGVMLAGKAFFSPAVDTSESRQARPAFQGTLPGHSASHNVSSPMTAAHEMTDDDIAARPEHAGPEGRDQGVDRLLTRDMAVPPGYGPTASDLGVLSGSPASGLDNDNIVEGVQDKTEQPTPHPDNGGISTDIIDDAGNVETWRVINKDTVLPVEVAPESKAASTHDSVSAPVADPVSQPESFPETASSGSSVAASSPTVPEFPDLDPSVGLTLQAVSWSPDPSRRLAVINGRLCREGESVDGFAVVRINPDDVWLSDGRISGKLVFNIR